MSVSLTTINGVLTATFTGTGTLLNATNLLNGATAAIIINYTTIGTNAFSGATSLTSITIPTSVTRIDNGAFQNATNLISITIPASVMIIGFFVFNNCSKLQSIIVDQNNTIYSSLDGVLFNKLQTALVSFPCGRVGSYIVPSSVSSIFSRAFSGAKSLTSITFTGASTLTSIGSYAFSGATSLTSITIPASVTSIGSYAFSGATSLTSITIPASVTSIGNYAFQNCSKLQSIIVDQNNTIYSSLDGVLFNKLQTTLVMFPYGMTGSYIVPSSVSSTLTSIGSYAFSGAAGLTSITFAGASTLTSIGSYAFFGATGLTSITIPTSVTSIGDGAFSGATSLTSIIFAGTSTLISIGIGAFSGATGLTSITIPTSVTSIGINAFYDATGLTSITIPASVTSIGDNAFRNCSKLQSIIVDQNNIIYSSLDGVLFDKLQTTILTFPCGRVGAYIVPSSVTSIFSFAFSGAAGLTSITIPASVTSIGDSAFQNCSKLQSIIVDHNNVNYSSLDGVLFNKLQTTLSTFPCNKVGSYIVPSSVTSIFSFAFSGATGLTSITIPASVSSIGFCAFYEAIGLTSITFVGTSTLTSIDSSVFEGATGLTSIIIPASVTSIGSFAFFGARSLTSITFAGTSTLTSIDIYAFQSATSLTSITIPASVTSIGDNSFANSSINIAYVSIPNGLNIPETTLNTRISFYGKSNVLILKTMPFTNFSLSPTLINERELYSGTLTSDSPTQPQYTILSQPINNLYISGNTLIARYPFYYREYQTYPVQLSGILNGYTIVRSFNIQIVNLPDAPISVNILNNNIPESSSIDTSVGTLTTYDHDLNDTFTYQFVSGLGSSDNSHFTILGNVLYTSSVLNYNTKNSYTIRVKSTDNNGLSVENPIILNVVLPIAGSFETSGLVGSSSSITLQGQNITGGDLIYQITRLPKYGLLTTVNQTGNYTYVPSNNNQDSFEYVVKEGAMTSLVGTVIISNYNQTDIQNIPRSLGTFDFDTISFDGTTWRFGTITTNTFSQGSSYYKLGNYTLQK